MKALLRALAIALALAAPGLAAGDQAPTPLACHAGVGDTGRQPGRSTIAMRQGGDGALIESSYEDAGWSGRLELRALSVETTGAIAIGATPLWDAGAVLAGDAASGRSPRPAPAERKIYTLLRKLDGTTATVPFTWDSLGAEERAWLDAGALGASRVAFLRGDRAREIGQANGVFRGRSGILGDSSHSTPLFVGAPSPAVQGPGYDSFYARFKSRSEAIYLGANDGMLHAFDARDGAELFAYVPNALLPFIGQLSDPLYRHRAFVDASAGQAEAQLSGQWRSVLVSGMGMGARGVFALDVSDPTAFGAGQGALWEFTERDDPAIAHIAAAPLIARIKLAATQFRYFAMVASDAQEADAGSALFLLALDKAPKERWKKDVNYFRLSLPGRANALGQPALVLAADGSVRFAYVGDLNGTLWRFDFSAKPPFTAQALFEARDDAGRRQPITFAPRVVFAPGGGYLVLFGTGKSIEEDGQPADFTPQSLYAVLDSAATPLVPVRGRSELARRTLAGDASYTVSGDEFDYAGASARKGWYFDFPRAASDGERLAAAPVLASGTVLATTVAAGADACGALPTRTYVLDALTGLANGPTGQAAKAPPGALPMVLQLGSATAAGGAPGGAVATRRLGIVHLQGGGAAPGVEQVLVTLPARRISWREVANWQELHDAANK